MRTLNTPSSPGPNEDFSDNYGIGGGSSPPANMSIDGKPKKSCLTADYSSEEEHQRRERARALKQLAQTLKAPSAKRN